MDFPVNKLGMVAMEMLQYNNGVNPGEIVGVHPELAEMLIRNNVGKLAKQATDYSTKQIKAAPANKMLVPKED